MSKNGDKYDFQTATYIADYHRDSSKVTKEWSGQIIVENALGDFVDGFYVDNGKVTGHAVKGNPNSRTNILTCFWVELWSCSYVSYVGYFAPAYLCIRVVNVLTSHLPHIARQRMVAATYRLLVEVMDLVGLVAAPALNLLIAIARSTSFQCFHKLQEIQ